MAHGVSRSFNLTGLVVPGNNVQLRWDMSTDGCGGTTFGWYVDNVRVYDCETDTDGDGVPVPMTIVTDSGQR